MPLRVQLKDVLDFQRHDKNQDRTLDVLESIIEAHDQKVRKEFAEEVIKTMAVPVEGKRFQAQYNAWKQMVAHIGAMAEEKR
jgi:hypothetical protein